ncbi:hypothetical protein HRE53_04225 [Acaryochloris sp. 'Moss Beach']|nr:hypothetical protein [Acaryochloris sp. 'Moss Beach']UJB71867.1 hypothetical protein HRE53_04225 [Acaryochloris sp. 'Moss Beach']
MKLSTNITVWLESDIQAFMDQKIAESENSPSNFAA